MSLGIRLDVAAAPGDPAAKPSAQAQSAKEIVRPQTIPVPGTASEPNRILLVDDDESDNNNIAGDVRLSASDLFYRNLLTSLLLPYDVVVVGRYAHGPALEKLRNYRLIVWYTGASYGGNRDNSAVISVKDEETLRRYLAEASGSVIVISPGYLSNVLGAGGAALWTRKESAFLQEVMGVRGGRGLLQRSKDATVVSADGATFGVSRKQAVEAQFSALNPNTAQTVFSALLDPDGNGPRNVAVATSQAVGAGRMVYVGFTLENLTADAESAFRKLLLAGGYSPAIVPTKSVQPSAGGNLSTVRNVRTNELMVTGIGQLVLGSLFSPRNVRTDALVVTGIGQLVLGANFAPRNVRTDALTVTGIGQLVLGATFTPRSVRTDTLTVIGIGQLIFGAKFVPRHVQTDVLTVTGKGTLR
jgi:hypothetical protein